jgi:hypothetical protein
MERMTSISKFKGIHEVKMTKKFSLKFITSAKPIMGFDGYRRITKI